MYLSDYYGPQKVVLNPNGALSLKLGSTLVNLVLVKSITYLLSL